MRRLVALLLIAIAGLLFWFGADRMGDQADAGGGGADGPPPAHLIPVIEDLAAKLPDLAPEDHRRLAELYGYTAVNIVKEHGRSGADALLALGPQGAAVMRRHPELFTEIAQRLGGQVAGKFLVFMRDDLASLVAFGGLTRLLDRAEALPPEARQLALEHPEMLPFLAVGDETVQQAMERFPELCLQCFEPIDLSRGPEGINSVARTILEDGDRLRDRIEARGLDAVLLAQSFPELATAVPPRGMEMPEMLQILSTNQEDLDHLRKDLLTSETVAHTLEMIAEADRRLPLPADPPEEPEELEAITDSPEEENAPAGETSDTPTEEAPETTTESTENTAAPDPADVRLTTLAEVPGPKRGDWIRLACIDPHAIRFFTEYGADGLRVLTALYEQEAGDGLTLPYLLFEAYNEPGNPDLRENTWRAMLEADGNERVFMHMLATMARYPDQEPITLHPRADRFRRFLTDLDHRVVPYLASAECTPKLSDYEMLEERGYDALDMWTEPPSLAVQCVPGYDLAHLTQVIGNGYTPTGGELLFAGIDLVFTTWDLMTLGGGSSVSQPIRTGMKTTAKTTARTVTREVVTEVGELAAKQALKSGARKQATRLASSLLRRMIATPKYVMQVARKGLTKLNPLIARNFAARSASRLGIHLSFEWMITIGAARGLQSGAKMAAESKNPAIAKKTQEVLRYLNALDSPL